MGAGPPPHRPKPGQDILSISKGRKTLAFSKATRYHRWMSWLAVGLYTFCHAQRSLQSKPEGQVAHRSPAMAAKLADHIWSTREWLLCPVAGG